MLKVKKSLIVFLVLAGVIASAIQLIASPSNSELLFGHLPDELIADNPPSDTQVPSYNESSGNFAWIDQAGGNGGTFPEIIIVTPFGNAGFESGTGYQAFNKEMLYQLQSSEDAGGYYSRQETHQFIPMNWNVDVLCGMSTEFFYSEEGVYYNGYVVHGDTNYGGAPDQVYDDESQAYRFAGFYYVSNAQYTEHLLAVTRNDEWNPKETKMTVTDLGEYQVGTLFFLKMEYREASVKFYVNGELMATHTTNIPWSSDPSSGKLGVSTQTQGYDEGILFFYWSILVWD